MPPPEPRSRTTSPGFSSASAVGLPQPREASTAAGGSSETSSTEYRSRLEMTASCDLRPAAGAGGGPPQQDAAASISGSSTSTAAPPQLTALAAEAYRARTASRTLSP